MFVISKKHLHTVDGRNPAPPFGCMKPYKYWGTLPISTGERLISEPSTVCPLLPMDLDILRDFFRRIGSRHG